MSDGKPLFLCSPDEPYDGCPDITVKVETWAYQAISSTLGHLSDPKPPAIHGAPGLEVLRSQPAPDPADPVHLRLAPLWLIPETGTATPSTRRSSSTPRSAPKRC